MKITREAVEQKLASLRVEFDKAMANVNGIHGAMTICQQLLEDKPEPKPTPEAVNGE